MARRRGRTTIKTSNTTAGRPGFSVSGFKGAYTGRKVGKGVVKNSRVTRLFVRDPSKKNALIGTSKDFNPNTKNATVGVPNPRILRAPHVNVRGAGTVGARAVAKGQKRVVAKINRSIRITRK